jgi:hypothetical protein
MAAQPSGSQDGKLPTSKDTPIRQDKLASATRGGK